MKTYYTSLAIGFILSFSAAVIHLGAGIVAIPILLFFFVLWPEGGVIVAYALIGPKKWREQIGIAAKSGKLNGVMLCICGVVVGIMPNVLAIVVMNKTPQQISFYVSLLCLVISTIGFSLAGQYLLYCQSNKSPS